MIRSLVIMADSLRRPMGGLGEQCRRVIEASEGVYFDVVGSPPDEPHAGDNFSFTLYDEPHIPVPMNMGLGRVIAAQTSMYAAASQRPRPDIVHAFDWSSYLAGVHLAKLWSVPLVVTMQLSYRLMLQDVDLRQQGELSALNAGVELLGLQRASAIVQVSRAYAQRFPAALDYKTFVIGNGIDLAPWQHPRPCQLAGYRRLKVVYIGRFDWMKNVQAMIPARIPDDVDLIFIGGSRGGDASLLETVKQWAKAQQNVHYVGPKYGQDKIDHLCAADAVVMPSIHEPFGIVALEALASRSILLSSFAGGMGDFLDRKAAVDCGTTPETIGAALQRLVEMSEREKATRIDRGLDICRRHPWRGIAADLRRVYEHVIGGRPTEPASTLP